MRALPIVTVACCPMVLIKPTPVRMANAKRVGIRVSPNDESKRQPPSERLRRCHGDQYPKKS